MSDTRDTESRKSPWNPTGKRAASTPPRDGAHVDPDDARYFNAHVLVTGETYGPPIDMVKLANFIQRCCELDGSAFKDDQEFRINEVAPPTPETPTTPPPEPPVVGEELAEELGYQNGTNGLGLLFDDVGDACMWCRGTGHLPGTNYVAPSKVGPPSCYHCNGTGKRPTEGSSE